MADSVVIFSFPGVKALDVVAPNEVFTCAAHLTDGGYEITIASLSGGTVTAESGLTFPTKALSEPRIIDTLVLPGGLGVYSARSNTEMMSWIRTASSRARRTVGMGTGGAGGIDTALAVVAEDFGAEVANEVARSLDLCQRGAGSPSQFASPVWDPRAKHDAIRQAQEAIQADPGAKHSVTELARRAAMSPRHFVRVFLADVGETPSAYLERTRIELARRNLAETADTVVTIAARCGFGTAETMRRTFARRIGVSPTEYRRKLGRAADDDGGGHAGGPGEPRIRTGIPRIATHMSATAWGSNDPAYRQSL